MRQFSTVVVAILVITCLSSTVEASLFGCDGCLSKFRARRACARQVSVTCVQADYARVTSTCVTSCDRPLLNAAGNVAAVPLKVVKGAAVITKGVITAPVKAVKNARSTNCTTGTCVQVYVE